MTITVITHDTKEGVVSTAARMLHPPITDSIAPITGRREGRQIQRTALPRPILLWTGCTNLPSRLRSPAAIAAGHLGDAAVRAQAVANLWFLVVTRSPFREKTSILTFSSSTVTQE